MPADYIDPFDMPRDHHGNIISGFYEAKKLSPDDRALLKAVREKDEDAMRQALASGANIDADDGEALMGAVRRGDADMAEWLLKAGANVHRADDHALRDAVYRGHLPLVQLLVEQGADLFALRCGPAGVAGGREDDNALIVTDYLTQAMFRQREIFLSGMAAAPAGKFLRESYGATQEAGLLRAVKMNAVAPALAALKEAGEKLTSSDLHDLKDREGKSLAHYATDRGQLKAFFADDLWQGRPEELIEAYGRLSKDMKERGGIDAAAMAGVISTIRQKELKEKAGKFRLKPPGL